MPPEFKETKGRKKRATKQRVDATTNDKVIIPSTQARDYIIFMFNAMVTMSIGEYARLTEQEYKAIADPLERMLKRLPGEASEKLAEYGDPIMLIMGFGMWGFRVFYQVPQFVKAEREKAAMRQYEESISRDIPLDPSQPATPPPPSTPVSPTNANGVVSHEDLPAPTTIPTGIRPDMQSLWEQKLD